MSAYLDIIILLVAAVFILMRLRNVLGTRPENEHRILVMTDEEWKRMKAKQARLDEHLQMTPEQEHSPLERTLDKIPGFYKADFCARAAKVFEMVLTAFATRDEETLKMLTGKKLFAKFQEIIAQRKQEGISAESDLIRIEKMDIQDAKLSPKGMAQIVVQFVSEQVNLLKNAAGEVIEGDENFVQKITDIWTFEKDIHASSPVWLLVSTKKK